MSSYRGTFNNNYVGFETRKFQAEESIYSLREALKEFLEYVENSDDELMPKEKIKLVVGDFFAENGIEPINVVAEDEVLLLDKWSKSCNTFAE